MAISGMGLAIDLTSVRKDKKPAAAEATQGRLTSRTHSYRCLPSFLLRPVLETTPSSATPKVPELLYGSPGACYVSQAVFKIYCL